MRQCLITRPASHCASLQQALHTVGVASTRWPLIHFQFFDLPCQLGDFVDVNFFFFPSQTAIEAVRGQWPNFFKHYSHSTYIAPGRGTAAMLQAQGCETVLWPEQEVGVEAVLALPFFQAEHVHGQKGVVFRGEQSNVAFKEGLLSRGACIEDVVCYRQCAPEGMPQSIQGLFQQGQVGVILTTSLVAARHLLAVLPEPLAEKVKATPITATSEKMLDWLMDHGFARVVRIRPGENQRLAQEVKRIIIDER